MAFGPFRYDETDPEGYRAGLFRPGGELGAKRTGLSVYELPPGQAVCPYHYEWVEEEWLLVLEGEVELRRPEGTKTLGARAVAFFAPGPEGAHGIRNVSEHTFAYVVMFSNIDELGATTYPDSDKIGLSGPTERHHFRRADGDVDYYDGE